MFEHLPLITDDNLRVMIDMELPHFVDLLLSLWERSPSGTEKPQEKPMDFLRGEFKQSNPNVHKAVNACVRGVAASLMDEGVDEDIAISTGVYAVPGLLAAFCLIDRALVAKELEERLGG